MSWVAEYKYHWYEKLAMNILKAGGTTHFLPRHIALIMDGNRRYARSEQMPKIAGHSKGFEKLSHCLRWCLDLGIQEVTTFAFSIENFKRSQEEVDDLLNLAIEKFEELLTELPKLHEYGVRLRVIGNISMLPLVLQKLIAKATLATEMNAKLFLNVAMAYTARDEITDSIEMIVKHGADHNLRIEDIDAELLDKCLYSQPLTTPDLLIRTSGESRLSDFLMWQLTSTVIYFTKVYWPEMNIWHFLVAIFHYQRSSHRRLLKLWPCKKQLMPSESEEKRKRIDGFVKHINTIRRDYLISLRVNE